MPATVDGLTCDECGKLDAVGKRWTAFLGREGPEAEVEVFMFCAECTREEFLKCEDDYPWLHRQGRKD